MTFGGIAFDWTLLKDVIQILILYQAFYWVLRVAKGSRFGEVLKGVGLLVAALIAFTYLLHFDVLARLLKWLLFYLALSSVVIFQAEIRRILATIGTLIFKDRNRINYYSVNITPELFTSYIFKLARRKMGALIAFERAISLKGYESSGVNLDALITSELLISIFTEPLPLHDGGIIIRNNRIASAHCLFPVSIREELSESGMRHRAAVGLSEETDALVIVVSEETGHISVAHNGELRRFPDINEETRASLLRYVRKAMHPQKSIYEKLDKRIHQLFSKKSSVLPSAPANMDNMGEEDKPKETAP